jgi:hypothetical protein
VENPYFKIWHFESASCLEINRRTQSELGSQ